MRVFDYLQNEIRDIKEMKLLSNGEHETIAKERKFLK